MSKPTSNVVSLSDARASREPTPPSWRCEFGLHLWSAPRGVEVRGIRVTLVQTCVRDRCRAARAEVW